MWVDIEVKSTIDLYERYQKNMYDARTFGIVTRSADYKDISTCWTTGSTGTAMLNKEKILLSLFTIAKTFLAL